MKNLTTPLCVAALTTAFATEAMATEWNVSLWGKRRAFTEHVHKLAELVEEKTNGDFTLNISYGGLSKNTENLDGISIYAFEMAQFCAGYHPDKNRAITVLELPFMGVNTLEEEVAVAQAVYDNAAVAKEMEQWGARLLMPTPMPQYNFAGKGDAPTAISDFEGMRVRALGGIGKLMEAVGAVPTSVTASETYQAIDSGTVNAASFAPHAHLSFKTIEASNWWTKNLNPGTVQCPVVVNSDALAALPADFREALDASVAPSLDYYLATYNKLYDTWWKTLDERNITQIEYSEEELAAFAEKAGPIHKAWVDENAANGLPAQELLDFVKSEIKG